MSFVPRVAFLAAVTLSIWIDSADAFRQRRRAKHNSSTSIFASHEADTEFRGTFRDMSLWVKPEAGARGNGAQGSDLWVVEFDTPEDMSAERERAVKAGLKIEMEVKLSIVLKGDVPGTLGYDACGSEADRRVISVADHQVVERHMLPTVAEAYKTKARTVDTKIADLLSQVSRASMMDTLTKLQSYTTRNSRSGDNGLNQATEFAAEALAKYGFKVSRDTFRSDMTPQIVAELEGVEEPSKIVVFGAHLDSTAGFFSTSRTRSPGADDNGSGSTAVLEFAKIISAVGARFKHTLRLCLFTGEEQGLIGSRAVASRWRKDGENIIAMFNADMLGYTQPGQPITLGIMTGKGDKNLIEIAIETTRTYVPELNIGETRACCSDQQSFMENGFPACGFFETPGRSVYYTQYHKKTDLLEYLDPQQIEMQATAAMASTALLAEVV